VKRIIDGVTYNTDTSTRLANSEYEADYNHQDRPCQGTLYQTRGGAFFVWETIDLGIDADGDAITRERFKALSAKEAESWIMTGDVEVFHNPFGEPPEAEAEPGATIYLRVPAALKKRVDAAATKASLSANSWAIRCLENCLSA
jgi:HicB family